MARAAATKEVQPDLLGGSPSQPKVETAIKEKKALAKDAPKQKSEIAVIKETPKRDVARKPAKSTPGNTLAIIAEALKDPNFKPENMRLVLDMHREMVAEQARLDFTVAMRELKRKLPTINKDGRIEYKDKGQGKPVVLFASFENIHDVTRPILDEFGFDLWFSSEPGASGMLNVVGHLDHENGHARTTIFPMPHDSSGGKSGAQGWSSAFSFGKRVATIGLLNIQTRAPVDRDRDGASPARTENKTAAKGRSEEVEVIADDGAEKITQEQHDKLIDALEACGAKRTDFCAAWNISKVADLPAEGYERAMKACADKARGKARG